MIVLISWNVSPFAQEVAPKDDEQIDFANGLFGRDLFEMAAVEYGNFLKKFPDSPYAGEARFGLGESYFFLESFEKAVTQYGQYIEFFPDGDKLAIANLRMGVSFFYLKKFNQALLNLLSIEPNLLKEDNRKVLFLYIGKVYLEKEEYNQAIESFDKASSTQKKAKISIRSLWQKANVLSILQKRLEAISVYKEVYELSTDAQLKSLSLFKQGEIYLFLEDYGKAQEYFQKVITDYPDEDISQQGIKSLLLTLFNSGTYDQVVETFTLYKDKIKNTSYFLKSNFILASAYDNLGQHDKSLEILDVIVKSNSSSPEDKERAVIKKTEVLLKSNQFELALELIETESIANSEQKDQVLFLTAESHFGQKEYVQAYDLYEKILKDFPKSYFADDALYGIAHTQNLLGKEKIAAQLFFQYFLDGENPEKKEEALFNALLISQNLSDIDTAIKYAGLYLDKLKSSEHFNEVQIILGKLYSANKQYSQAINLFEKYIEVNRKSTNINDVYFLLAYNFQLDGRLEEALENYEVITFDEQKKDLYFSALKNSALIYLERGDEKKSLQLFVRIIEDNTKNDLDLKTYLWIVEKLQKNEQFELSLNILNQAESQFEGHKLLSGIYYFQGVADQKLSRFDDSISKFDQVLLQNNESYTAPSLLGKAVSLNKLKKYDLAKEIFNQVILNYADDNTMSMRARFELAYIEQENNNLDAASKLYMLIAVLYDDEYYSPESLLRAGQLFEQLNKKSNALKVYEEILQKYASSHAVSQARKKYDQLKAL